MSYQTKQRRANKVEQNGSQKQAITEWQDFWIFNKSISKNGCQKCTGVTHLSECQRLILHIVRVAVEKANVSNVQGRTNYIHLNGWCVIQNRPKTCHHCRTVLTFLKIFIKYFIENLRTYENTHITVPAKNGNNEWPCVDFCFRILLQRTAPLNWCKYVTAAAEVLIKSL